MVGGKHMTDDCLYIRPSGDPLTVQGFQDMFSSGDVKMDSAKLLDIYKIVITGNTAYSVYSFHGVFSYKGQGNDDIAVFTELYQKIDGVWKIVHGQRSTGRKPDDPKISFPN